MHVNFAIQNLLNDPFPDISHHTSKELELPVIRIAQLRKGILSMYLVNDRHVSLGILEDHTKQLVICSRDCAL